MCTPRWIRTVIVVLSFGVLSTTATGCWMFEKQRVQLDDITVTELTERWGTNFEGMRQELSSRWGVQIEKIEKVDNKLDAVLSAPALQAAEDTTITLIDGITKNPTTSGIVAALIAALGVGAQSLRQRKRLQDTVTTKKKVGGT